MKSLVQILRQGNDVLAKNLSVLLFMALLFDLLQQALIPTTHFSFSNPTWLGIIATAILLRIAFEAGWMNMMQRAVQTATLSKIMDNKPAEPTFPQFNLLKGFLPGVGQFFTSFLMARLLEVLFILIPAGIAWYAGNAWIGIPKNLPTVPSDPSQAAWQTFSNQVFALPVATQEQLAQWGWLMLLIVVIALLCQFFTMLWRPILIMDECSVLQALGRSIRQVAKDPLPLMGIALLMGVNLVLIFLMIQQGSVWLVVAAQFLMLILTIYLSLVLFLYWQDRRPLVSELDSNMTSYTDVPPSPQA